MPRCDNDDDSSGDHEGCEDSNGADADDDDVPQFLRT